MNNTTESNVISMNEYLEKNGNQTKLLDDCRKLMNERLSRSVATMMDKADDMLFDLSQKNDDVNERANYFYAMREMRLKRQDIESNFHSKFNKLFDSGIHGKLGVNDMHPKATEIEESVALENTIKKTQNTCREALLYLDQRMGKLLGDPEMKKVVNPLRPEAVCNAFQEACENIETDIEIKLILFKLFDKYVTSELQDVYIEINNLLSKEIEEPAVEVEIEKPELANVKPNIKDRTFYIKANTIIKDAINGRTGVESLPEFARSFLSQHWSKLLLKIYIRDGAGGNAWIHAVDVIDDMVNCLGSNTSIKEKQSLSGLMPNLKQRLRYGMNVIPLSPTVRDEFLNEMTQYYNILIDTRAIQDDPIYDNETEDITVPKFAKTGGSGSTPFMSELLKDDGEESDILKDKD